MRYILSILGGICLFMNISSAMGAEPYNGGQTNDPIQTGVFRWIASPPLASPADRLSDPCFSVKDPTVVYYEGAWHLFCTIRSQKRTHQIEYSTFKDWNCANEASRHILSVTNGYFCAPQVFYFTPQKKWYLIYQTADASRKPALQPACSTTGDIADPASWSKPTLLFRSQPDNIKAWIDFWVICDDAKAHLFFTSLDGRLWRSDALLSDFPHGWSQPEIVLQADIFEAGHIYSLKGRNQYFALIEDQKGSRRYYKAYLSKTLDGEWAPLADAWDKPFASLANVSDKDGHWTDSFSHGELLRSGCDQKLEADPGQLRFLFQGVSDAAMAGKKYGEIPWRLGILEPAK
ncbi:MAG: non-reducing end alpha-L-arabinofuranosidase family hydrolase [Candidatus Omnitrophota bacterium]